MMGRMLRVERSSIPHLAKNERDAPNFLHADLDKTACAPFIKERRMEFAEPTKPHRKSGMWGTPGFIARLELRIYPRCLIIFAENVAHTDNCCYLFCAQSVE
jgi:hypothetical protein